MKRVLIAPFPIPFLGYNIYDIPRLKHPVKVHVWAGISWRGPIGVRIVDGILDAPFYTRILNGYLIPFRHLRG